MAKQKELKQVKMTDEIRTKLHGFSIMKNSINVKYKLDIEDVPEEYIPVFTLKTLSVSEIEEMNNTKLSDDTEEYYNDLIRSHIMGWKMYDTSCEPVEEVKYIGGADGVDKELYDQFPTDLRLLLLRYLTAISRK